jgi:hypothetical protein
MWKFISDCMAYFVPYNGNHHFLEARSFEKIVYYFLRFRLPIPRLLALSEAVWHCFPRLLELADSPQWASP